MAWKRARTGMTTSLEIDLEEFETEQLLQSLINRDVLSESEAERLLKRDALPEPEVSTETAWPAVIKSELSAAIDEARCGRHGEARIHLERALGRDFIGVLT